MPDAPGRRVRCGSWGLGSEVRKDTRRPGFDRRRTLGGPMEIRDKLYIDGAWVPSTGKGTLEVFDSNTEEVIGKIPEGTAEDAEKAVEAASAAFGEWSSVSHEERSKLLARA